jgi:protein FRA10AC1
MFAKHERLIEVYQQSKSESQNRLYQTTTELLPNDIEALQRNHQFVRDDEEDEKAMSRSWEVRMARKYYNRLFKEYAVGDFSRYREGKIGLRWRVEREVLNGKGQFTCGSLSCAESNNLESYEVPFRYTEGGLLKHELVKIRVCEECAVKLFYKKLESVPEKKKEKAKKRKRKSSEEDSHFETRDHRRLESPPHEEKVDAEISIKLEPEPVKDTFGMENYLKELFF